MEQQPSTSRILYDVPCSVCKDHSSGKHYGVFACDGCAGFFKRSVRRDRQYTCKARVRGHCLMDKTHRNQCRACRLNKCLEAGMNRDAVQHERGPRNSTIRRQMSLYFSEPVPISSSAGRAQPSRPPTPPPRVSPPRARVVPPVVPVPLFPYPYNALGMMHPALLQAPRPPLLAPRPVSPLALCLNLSDPHSICESAARILFMNVKWAKNVIRFDTLSLTDRMLLLRASWKNLFMIASAQFMSGMNLRSFLNTGRSITLDDIKAYERVLAEFNRLRPTKEEYGCIKGYTLFETRFDGANEMHDPHFCANVQAYCDTLLLRYATDSHPMEPADRMSDIRSLVPLLSTVPGNVIIELFFRATIGQIPIEKIIVDMYANSKMMD